SLDAVRTGHELMRRQITRMVEDAIGTSNARLAELKPESVADIHNAAKQVVSFSEDMGTAEKELKRFMYAKLYRHPDVMEARRGADRIVRDLFQHYFSNPRDMPEGWREGLDSAEERIKARDVGDFIAGMTDTYAIREHKRLFDHTPEL